MAWWALVMPFCRNGKGRPAPGGLALENGFGQRLHRDLRRNSP
jgi:hypothetical protein